MYGLIHKALSDMVIENHGAETWQRIVEKSGVPSDSFLAMRSYGDHVTLALVGAASDVLGADVDTCLHAFGEFWLAEFAPKTYEMLLSSAGDNLFDFLENLDALHDRITTTFVGYIPPSFRLERLSDTQAILTYISSRNGMVPFVLGLVKGMEQRFAIRINCELIEHESNESGDRARFMLSIGASDG